MQVHSLSYDADTKRWSARFPAGDSPRTLVTVFGAPELVDQPELFIDVARAYPRSLVVGCSSAGVIQGATVRDRSLAVTVTRFDRTDLQLVSASLTSVSESEHVGEELGQRLAAKPGLRAVLVLCDGLSVNGAVLARALGAAVGPKVTVTGGLAADGQDFKQTWLTVGGSIKRGAVAAVGFYGPNIVVGYGVSHDWKPQDAEWVITRCEGNYVYELDYQPALEVYQAALRGRADELPDVAIWYPLEVRAGTDAPVVRTVIGLDEQEGALVLAGEVRHGQSAHLMTADLENLIEGGAHAASGVARTGAPVSVDCLALAVSCFGRRKILGLWSGEELVGLREGLHAQRTTVTGFYGYGQIAPEDGQPAALHNQTLTVTVFSEARPAEAAPVRVPRAVSPPAGGYAVRSTLFDAAVGTWSSPLPDLDSPRTLVLMFGGPAMAEDARAITELRERYPGSVLLGCSTAGAIHDTQVEDHGAAVSITRFARTDLRLVVERVVDGDAHEAGKRLAARLTAHAGLQGVLLVSDGLGVNGSALARGLNEVIGGSVPIAGGLAGDGTAFKQTWVLAGDQVGPGMIAAVGFYGLHVVVGHGSRGGCDRFGMKRTITRASGNVLFELDGRSALAIYQEYLGERARYLPVAGLSLPLAVRDPVTDSQVVRTLVAIDESAGSVTFAGDVPVGHLTQFMKADVERLINGATHAALMATENGPPAAAEALVVAVSCAGRRHMLGAHTEEEIEALGETFRSERVRVSGFYAYGEFTPGSDGSCELNNQAMTVFVVSEALTPVGREIRPARVIGTPAVVEVAAAPTPAPSPTPPSPLPAVAVARPVPTVSAPSPQQTSVLVPSAPVVLPAPALAHSARAAPPELRGPIVRVPRAGAGEINVEQVADTEVRVIRISGRLTEAFQGETASRMLHGRVILDLGDIHRITSFGVREWLAMFAGAIGLTECYLVRCSESVVNQLTMIRAFDGGAKLLSFFAPYLCGGCNKPFERLFDSELDAEEIGSASPVQVRCPRCDELGKFDDDPRSYFAFFGQRTQEIPSDVRAQHIVMCAQDRVRRAEEVEKIVEGDLTRVRIAGRLSLNIRWRRVFENIDGPLVVDLASVTAIEPSGLHILDVHLRTLTARGRPIGIEHAPISLLERWESRPAHQIEIVSAVVDAFCSGCGVMRTATVVIAAYLADPARASVATCKRCDRRLELRIAPAFIKYVTALEAGPPEIVPASAETSPPSTEVPVPTALASSLPPARRWPMVVAGIALVGLGVGWSLRGGAARHGDAGAAVGATRVVAVDGAPEPVIDAGSAWKPADDLPPAWADRPFTVDGTAIFLVGESEGDGPQAVARARDRATAALIRQLADDLAQSATGRFLAASGVPAISPAAIARFASQYGKLASFERIDTAESTVAASAHLFVRFKLPKASYDQMLAAYGEVVEFRGMTVAEFFPTLATQTSTKANLIVVAVQPGSVAAAGSCKVGDGVLRIGDTVVTSLAEMRQATKRAWMQPDVRATLTIEVESVGVPRRIRVGLRRGR